MASASSGVQPASRLSRTTVPPPGLRPAVQPPLREGRITNNCYSRDFRRDLLSGSSHFALIPEFELSETLSAFPPGRTNL